ncbi:MAG: hypothetical protein WHV44_01305 [Anaerolineales bacterium]
MPQDPIFWRNVEPFIGRQKTIESLLQRLKGPGFHLVTVSGEYGYGKTRLLDRLLERANNPQPVAALPSVKIDLYESKHHTPGGLAQAIVDCFPRYSEYFQNYGKLRIEYEDAKVAGNVGKAQKTFWDMLDACIDGLSQLSQEHGVLLLLDTAERWVYPDLGASPFPTKSAPAWEWLRDKVRPSLKRGLVILAGRPEISNLELGAENRFALEPFNLQETRDYIQETCNQFKTKLNLEPPQFSEDEIQRLHHLSQGRPILLALFLELIAHGDQRISEQAFKAQPADFEPLLVKHLMESPNLGELVRAVGRAPKGVDLELLSSMTGLSKSDLEGDFKKLKGLSFAKTFEGNSRLFLHEEMYAILGRHVYNHDADQAEARQASKGIRDYYKQHIHELNEEIGRLYINYAAEIDDLRKRYLAQEIEKKAGILEILNVDFVYYRWRHVAKMDLTKNVVEDPIDMGLRRYYRLAHEAAASNEANLLVLLRAELIGFIHELEKRESSGLPQPWLPFLRGFARLQRVLEQAAMGKDYKGLADRISNEILDGTRHISGISPDQKKVLVGLLTAWRGHILMYSGDPDYVAAMAQFKQVVRSFQNWSEDSNLRWLAHAALVLAYRQIASLCKQSGLFHEAIKNYNFALSANRGQDFKYEEAIIRNDLGDTRVLLGDFSNAQLVLLDALSLREKMRHRAPLALSFSTLSRYHISQGGYYDALNFAERSKNLSTMVGRNTVLTRISLAEAIRRYARQGFSHDTERQREEINRALIRAQEAVQGLESRNELALLAESYVELGCIFRDRSRLQSSDSDRKHDFEEANKYLLKAKDVALKRVPPILLRAADAMANRIWLGLFAEDEKFARQAAKEFEELDFWGFSLQDKEAFRNQARKMAKTDRRPLLQYIGKYHIGLGMLEFGREKRLDEENVNKVAWHWMLGLEYSRLFADRFRGQDAARQTIYKDLIKLNPKELRLLASAILTAQQDAGISNSSLKKLMQDNSLWFDLYTTAP